ncbi:hypothetical protein Tco_0474731, partial [Tanacetum coccineum]
MQVVQVILWYLDSGCSKHMTGNRSKLKNFVEKFIGTVRFGNDHVGAIMGYGDYMIGDSVISRVYYVEGIGHNIFSVGQFCDSDLEVAFRKHSCFVRNMDDVWTNQFKLRSSSNDFKPRFSNVTKASAGISSGPLLSGSTYISWVPDESIVVFGASSEGTGSKPRVPDEENSGLALVQVPATANLTPTDKDLEILFQPMFDEYFEQSTDSETVHTATVVNAPIVSMNTSVSTTIAQDAPSTSGPNLKDTSITQAGLHPSVNLVAGEPDSAQSTSGD